MPNFLIIGAARSGTTWAARNLMLHPEAFLPRKKEIHYFDRHYDMGIEWYKKFFEGRKEKAVGEATPAYLYFSHIPEAIHQHLPNVKLIAILRNPMDRAFSHYLNLRAKTTRERGDTTVTFEEKIRVSPRLIDEGRYAVMLHRYYSLFPRENIGVFFYDDLKERPCWFLERMYSFLGIDVGFRSTLRSQDVNASSVKLGRSGLLAKAYAVCFRLRMYRTSKWLGNIVRTSLPSMDGMTRKMLLDQHYSEDIRDLEEMIDVDLSGWRKS